VSISSTAVANLWEEFAAKLVTPAISASIPFSNALLCTVMLSTCATDASTLDNLISVPES
jgi:hypothetical protein